MKRIRQTNLFLHNTPLIIALGLTFAAVAALEFLILKATGGTFMYPLDDPFIHMEVARNLADHGTWGINQPEFASASSSILYTILLATIFKIFGTAVTVPFIVNCIAAVLLLIAIDRWLVKNELSIVQRIFILLTVVIILPLPVMVISGMEHTLQCLFSFLFISRFADWASTGFSTKANSRFKIPLALLLYGILATAIRYEGLFLVGAASLLLLFQKRLVAAIAITAVAMIPIVVFGLVSIQCGSYFLPNPVFIKSEGMGLSSLQGIAVFINNILVNKFTVTKTQGAQLPGVPPPGISLLTAQRLLIILPLLYLFFVKQFQQQKKYAQYILLLTIVTLMHLAFASTGWFYRYEAYLVLNAVVIIMVVLIKNTREALADRTLFTKAFAWVLAFALFFPFVLRSSAALSKTKAACINIYDQQFQMARMLQQQFPGVAVAANDIGAIAYYTDATIVDLWGLGSIEIARSKKNKYWTPEFLDSLVRSRQVKLAIVYDEWFDAALLNRWTKVGTWKIQNNVITGGDTVSFYAINAVDAENIRQKMQQYQSSLPATVEVKYNGNNPATP